ncbi:MAG: hypothetical protein QXF12_00215 [Candidatus Aenigmatarchaeota archaeon]
MEPIVLLLFIIPLILIHLEIARNDNSLKRDNLKCIYESIENIQSIFLSLGMVSCIFKLDVIKLDIDKAARKKDGEVFIYICNLMNDLESKVKLIYSSNDYNIEVKFDSALEEVKDKIFRILNE